MKKNKRPAVRPEHQAAARRLLAKLLTYERRTFGYVPAYEEVLLSLAAGNAYHLNPSYCRFYRYRWVTQDLLAWFARYLVNGPSPYPDAAGADEAAALYLRRTDPEALAEHRVMSQAVWYYVLYIEPNADTLYHGS